MLEAKRIHDLCLERGVPVWCGGMLETGVGRALNLALAALPGFTLPGDTSASARYFHEDLTEPFELAPDGTMAVPTGPGIGVTPRPDRLAGVRDPQGARPRLRTKSDKNAGPRLTAEPGGPVWFALRNRWSPRVPAVSHFPGPQASLAPGSRPDLDPFPSRARALLV